jgi:hypothetical protein
MRKETLNGKDKRSTPEDNFQVWTSRADKLKPTTWASSNVSNKLEAV